MLFYITYRCFFNKCSICLTLSIVRFENNRCFILYLPFFFFIQATFHKGTIVAAAVAVGEVEGKHLLYVRL